MSDVVMRLNAALEGRYRIERELGEGGMATVYLADDLRHDRKVAVKVLKPELVAVVGARRFLAEIKTTANLQHPHILPLFDSGEADGFLFYVMPYVEGDSLRSRLEREKQLPVNEAVDLVVKVAHALDYAHRHGVVHRDIKPANLLLHDGEPVVADFGIARALSVEVGRLTETGLSLGTPAYMSPEQCSGERDVGPGADVYALGCVLYELLAGRPPYTGSSAQAIVAKALTRSPVPVEEERETVPPPVSRAVAKALQRLPADRFATAGQFAAALVAGTGLTDVRADEPRAWLVDWRTVVTLGALAGTVAVAAIIGFREPSGDSSGVMRFTVSLPDDRRILSNQVAPLALSRDGTLLVYVGADTDSEAEAQRLYLRRVDRLEPEPLPRTEGATAPFFSPDGAWVGFFAAGELKKVPLAGGTAITLAAPIRTFAGRAAWLDDGTIVFPTALGRLEQVSDAGGTARTVLDDSTVAVLGLAALPRARGVMFFQCPLVDCPGASDLVGLELPAGTRRTLVESRTTIDPLAPSTPVYASSGHLLYGRPDGTLMAAPLDAEALAVEKDPVPVLGGMLSPDKIALSATGTLAYLAGSGTGRRRIVLVDRSGSPTPLALPPRAYGFPRLGPTTDRLATEIHDETGGHIWLHDLASRTLSRLTMQGHNPLAVWAPDGSRVAYFSFREGGPGIFTVPVNRGSAEREILHLDAVDVNQGVTAWSPDGRWILFDKTDAHGNRGLFVVAASGDEDARPLVVTPADESGARFSPDGRWIVYQSNESGSSEVYVTSFPEPGGRWPVSSDGGRTPTWRGNEIFYRRFDGMYVATFVPGEEPSVRGRQRLFDDTAYRGAGATFDVTPDGQHFVMLETLEEPAELVVTLNWFEELRQLTAEGR